MIDTATLELETEQTILADAGRLQQLFENLIRNAIEHGGPYVRFTVGAPADGFYIEDTGPDTSNPDRNNIFSLGYSTNEDATEFGLGIIKEIVDAHG